MDDTLCSGMVSRLKKSTKTASNTGKMSRDFFVIVFVTKGAVMYVRSASQKVLFYLEAMKSMLANNQVLEFIVFPPI